MSTGEWFFSSRAISFWRFSSLWLAWIVFGSVLLIGTKPAFAQRPQGIDVSKYQTNINWASVKAGGYSFAWIKATEGTGYTDPGFTLHAQGAKNAGVIVGIYHFARPDLNTGTAGASDEASWCWSVIKNYIKTGGAYMVPALDMERAPGGTYTKTTLSQWVNKWCQDIVNLAANSNVTLRPIIYTGSSYANSWLDSSVTQWRLWIADPNGQNPQTGSPIVSLSPWSTWTAWQYSWTTPVVPGVSGDCDHDVYNGTFASFVTNLVIGGTVNQTNPPTIVTQPQSLTLNLGSPAMFNVYATGVGPLSFQWRFNQTNLAGATATNYNLASVQLTNAGAFSVAVSNAGGITISTQAFLSVLSPLTNAPGCILSPSNMVNWWPAEGNLNDIFNTNKATPHDGFSYVGGKQMRAFRFDGLTGYLSVTATSIPPPWTACMWVNRQNAPASGAALMGDGAYELKLEQYNGTRQVGFTQFGVGDFNFGYSAPVGVWTHLAFVGTVSGTSLYTNGVLQSTLPNTLPLPRAYIGAGYVTSSVRFVDFMQGGLDEILCYNRALTAAEINAIYSAGSAGLVRVPEFTGMTPLENGQVRVNLKGQTGKNFTIYTSSNFTTWANSGVVPNPTGSTQFTNNPVNPQTFFRASQP